MNEITQVSIYLKEQEERINEIALFNPLGRKSAFDEKAKPLQERKWCYTHNLPLVRRLGLKVQTFLFKHIPACIPDSRITKEAKFKTVLAILLAQEPLRDFFLTDERRRASFFKAVHKAAKGMGYEKFSLPGGHTPLQISQNLTWLDEKGMSLIDDLVELNLQMASISHLERNEIMFQILNEVERPPIHSILEVMREGHPEQIALTTQYAKYKVSHIEPDTGKVAYSLLEDHATSSIRTRENIRRGVKGALNQRSVVDSETGAWLGSYTGELSTQENLLEQILFILHVKDEEVFITEEGRATEEKKILFTSLFSWHEFGLISEQHAAIRALDQHILRVGERAIRLNLLHFNVSFNAFNKFPTPGEMEAALKDINEEGFIHLTWEVWQQLGLENAELTQLKRELDEVRLLKAGQFLKRQERVLAAIDTFRELKSALIAQVEGETPLEYAAKALLSGKKRGMDLLLYLNVVAHKLGYLHNKNCQNATDRSAGANAADKALYAYHTVHHKPFLPDHATEEELSLFKVLYSMYLVWEEPELNAALSTGFIGEKFYHNFFQKNPETTRYLIHWLKKHPEIYLGLSDLR